MNTARQTNHHTPHSNLAEMYPGIYRPGSDSLCDSDDGPNLPTGPLNTLLGFELETYQIPLDQLLPSKKVPDGVMSTRKYKQIVSTRILRNMKAARQVEAVELMIASNTITVAHAEALLKATPPEQRTDVKPWPKATCVPW